MTTEEKKNEELRKQGLLTDTKADTIPSPDEQAPDMPEETEPEVTVVQKQERKPDQAITETTDTKGAETTQEVKDKDIVKDKDKSSVDQSGGTTQKIKVNQTIQGSQDAAKDSGEGQGSGVPEGAPLAAETAEEGAEASQPKKDISSIYNADDEMGEQLRRLYDLKEGRLVPKATDADPDPESELNAITAPLDKAEGEITDAVTSMLDLVKKEEEKQKTEDKENNRLAMWAGATEAAASLVNLFGTIKGATSQKWQSPLQGWQARADAIRKERDAKLEGYRKQVQALNKAKTDLDVKRAALNSTYHTQKELSDRSNARIAATTATAIAKAEIAAEAQLKRVKETGRNKISEGANRLLNTIIRENASLGMSISEANVRKWADMAFRIQMDEYKDLHPEEFEDTILP